MWYITCVNRGMLIHALGYDGASREYQGATWLLVAPQQCSMLPVDQHHRDKTNDRLLREWIAARDEMDAHWQDGLKAEAVVYHLTKFAAHYTLVPLIGIDECNNFLNRSNAESFAAFVQEVKQHFAPSSSSSSSSHHPGRSSSTPWLSPSASPDPPLIGLSRSAQSPGIERS